MSKLFKFWRWRLQVKLNKLPDEKRIEVLANELIKELNVNVDKVCQNINIWIYDKECLKIDSSAHSGEVLSDIFEGKYTGK